jgi:flagellar motor switch/type III secretory pathway protein FliN
LVTARENRQVALIGLARIREFREKTLKFSTRTVGDLASECGRVWLVERVGWEVHGLPEHGPSVASGLPSGPDAFGLETAPTALELTAGASALSVEIERLLQAAHTALRPAPPTALSDFHLPIDHAADSPADAAKPTALDYQWPCWDGHRSPPSAPLAPTGDSSLSGASAAMAIPVRLVVARLSAPRTAAELATADAALPLVRNNEQLVELRWNGKTRARGTLVAIDGHYGVRITEILTPSTSSLS